jgi:hypothetical protein
MTQYRTRVRKILVERGLASCAWIITSGLMGASMLLLQPAPAAAGNTATITIRAEVPMVSSVHVQQTDIALSGDLREPVSDALLTQVQERSNNRNGYTVTILSDSARDRGHPALVNVMGMGAVPYRLTYGGEHLRFIGGQAVLSRASRTSGSAVKDMAISTSPAGDVAPGRYSDRLTLILSAR